MFDQRISEGDSFKPKWTFLMAHEMDCIAMYEALNISSPHCILYEFDHSDGLEGDKNWT